VTAPASTIDRLAAAYGRLLSALALLACLLVLAMMIVICLDVLLRNVRLFDGLRSVPGANEISEYTLYLVTALIAPWLLRQGQHIRVDIVLRVIPNTAAWLCEWIVDVLALLSCLVMAWYGWKAMTASMGLGSMVLKSVVFPEWWILAPMPLAFVLLAIEVLFRMHRLANGPRAPREDAVSSA
jgi:TRAP-type C4-dicarboxylate transport system permease small subunit